VKVLLDENLAHRLRKNLGTHEVFTVSYKDWAGLKNGELLRAAENDGIEVFLTGDQTLTHEQNLTGRTIAIVALTSGRDQKSQFSVSKTGFSLTGPPGCIASTRGSATP
jgi:hypothetical protein